MELIITAADLEKNTKLELHRKELSEEEVKILIALLQQGKELELIIPVKVSN